MPTATISNLLKQMPNPNIHETPLTPKDFVKEDDILHFFMEEVDDLLKNYEPGNPENKQDVKKQLSELKVEREQKMQDHIKKQIIELKTLSEDLLNDGKIFSSIQDIIHICINTFENGNKVLFCGNSGSAAEAQHLAAELSGKFKIDRNPLK